MNKLFIALIGATLLACAISQRTCSTHATDATKNCLACSDGTATATCTFCYPGYSKIGGVCTQCKASGCETCAAADTCDTCQTGYFKSGTGTSTICTKCTTGCADCSASGLTSAACTTCAVGYSQINGAGDCVKCDDSNCADCSTVKTTCETDGCTEGYYLNTATPKGCTICPVSGCADCSGAAGNCAECKSEGFYPSGTAPALTCNTCPSGCKVCTSGSACVACEDQEDLLTEDAKTCVFGYKATASFTLIAAALLSLIF